MILITKKQFLTLFLALVICQIQVFSQTYTATNLQINKVVEGTLLMPDSLEQPRLAIIVSDYGPVDRDGNQNFSNNAALKKLAEALAEHGIASFRYDKRTFHLNRQRKPVNSVLFDDFVMDASAVIQHFSDSGQFSSIHIIGHGQGSLVGMLAVNDHVTSFISLGGAAQSIDATIVEQVTMMDEELGKEASKIVGKIKNGQNVSDIPQPLMSVFNKDVQPFMASWMQYEPTEVLSKLTIPILIINGSKDLQVSTEEAQRLAKSNDGAKLIIIDGMNHVLFIIEGDDLENSKSYNEPFRKISEELVEAIQDFIHQ